MILVKKSRIDDFVVKLCTVLFVVYKNVTIFVGVIKTTMDQISQKIEAVRKEKGLTQEELAGILKMSRNNLLRLIKRGAKLSIHQIETFASALGVETQEILEDYFSEIYLKSVSHIKSQFDNKDLLQHVLEKEELRLNLFQTQNDYDNFQFAATNTFTLVINSWLERNKKNLFDSNESVDNKVTRILYGHQVEAHLSELTEESLYKPENDFIKYFLKTESPVNINSTFTQENSKPLFDLFFKQHFIVISKKAGEYQHLIVS